MKSRTFTPRQASRSQRITAGALYHLLRSLLATVRLEFAPGPPLLEDPDRGPVIYCLWHNRLALAPKIYHELRRLDRSRPLAALVSASRDGAFLAHLLRLFGMQAVRGSSSRRGSQAMLELTTLAEKGFDLAITPDGPRGPCYVVQEGVVALAQITQMPIIPAGTRLPWKASLNSWDRFQVPFPFTRCSVRFGSPILVARDASAEERERLRKEVERALMELSEG